MSFKTAFVFLAALAPCLAVAQTPDRTQLPIPDVESPTYSELDVRNLDRPKQRLRVAAPKDAPNTLVLLLDDVGFSQSSLFGGAADMPALEALAKDGLPSLDPNFRSRFFS